MDDKIIFIKSRTHDKDICGVVLDSGKTDYEYLNIPMEHDSREQKKPMPETPKKRVEYNDAEPRVGDDSWRKAIVLWARLGIPLPPGQSTPYIYKLAAALEGYRQLENPEPLGG